MHLMHGLFTNIKQCSLFQTLVFISFITLTMLLTGCATNRVNQYPFESLSYVLQPSAESPEEALAPVFSIFENNRDYNRIGTVVARRSDDGTVVAVSPDEATIYNGITSFTTTNGTYLNHIYRVHFERIPFSLFPFHLAFGAHPGILIIITTNTKLQPMLVTTVNTCGCYISVIPTENLPGSMLPEDYPQRYLSVYGEKLPAQLSAYNPVTHVLEIIIRPEIHRVMDLRIVHRDELVTRSLVKASISPLARLRNLPLGNGEYTSFYYERWPLTGHVKGAIKWWETILLSIPSMDFFVGMDKDFGDTMLTGNPFYTSLKPWNRNVSDLNDFPAFLRFYGWTL